MAFGLPITSPMKLVNMDRFLQGCNRVALQDATVCEVGCFQGGSIRYLAERHPHISFHGYDTFSGLCEATDHDTHSIGDFSNTDYDKVFKYLADLPNVTLVQGVYPLSCKLPPRNIVMAHVDVDTHDSTYASLVFLNPFIMEGGRIYCDDVLVPSCHGATVAFLEFAAKYDRKVGMDEGLHSYIQF